LWLAAAVIYCRVMATAKIGPLELYYEEHGSGEPLLLIMGLATPSEGWTLQAPEFAKHYRTIVYDNRGVGRSTKPAGPYTIHEMAEDAIGLMDHLGIERADVLGISMGGMIAQELVLRHPDRVRGLVLACTYPEPDEAIERERKVSVSALGGTITEDGETKVDLAGLDPLTFFQLLMPKVFNAEFLATQLPMLMEVFGGTLQWGFSIEAILAQVEACVGHNATERLGTIQAPTLVITGDSDLLIPPSNSDVLAERIPGAKLVKVPGGSHGFNFETPDAFNREVLDFLATVPSS